MQVCLQIAEYILSSAKISLLYLLDKLLVNKNIEKIIYIVVKTTTEMAQRGKFLLFCLHKCKKIPFFFVISSNYSNFATTNLK